MHVFINSPRHACNLKLPRKRHRDFEFHLKLGLPTKTNYVGGYEIKTQNGPRQNGIVVPFSRLEAYIAEKMALLTPYMLVGEVIFSCFFKPK